MLRTRRSFRFFAILAAAFQMALPPALAVADAIVQQNDGPASRIHIEDHGHKDCRPGHPDTCVLCQTLSHWAAPLPSDAALLRAAARAAQEPVAVATTPLRVPYSTPHSRGPPA